METHRFTDKVAFITGAARGQGRSHAVRLAEEGADVIAVDICEQVPTIEYEMPTETDLEETVRLVEAQGRRIFARKADVREHDRLAEIVADGVAELGRLDFVVANAGVAHLGGLTDLSSQGWQEVLDINAGGVWATCKAAAPHIIEGGRGGAIVITSSIAGLHALEGVVHYVTSKFGVVGLMRATARELGPHMIRVNSVHPTQVDTPMLMNEPTYRAFAPEVEDPGPGDLAGPSQAMHVMPVPWVDPIDVSNAVLFLLSDEARYITGVRLAVDLGADVIG